METIYKTDGICEVKAGNKVIAKSFVGSNGYEVRILQGMPKVETMEKIKRDCPEFLIENGVPENYYPKTFKN